MKMHCFIAAALVAAAAGAHAHQPWVLPVDARVAPGDSTAIRVYFGHAFPEADLMAAERLAGAAVASPDGAIESVDPGGDLPFATPSMNESGTWVIGVEQARGYWTKTPDGGRPLPRSEVSEAVRCSYSGNAAKTLMRVGDAEVSSADRALGHRLEILPDADPTRLGAGDALAVQVRFDGAPHSGPLMAFHADSGESPYVTLETDDAGRAEVALSGQGPWMLLARAERPYPDPSICDVESFHASLTFGGSE